jgi:ubiquinone/menaquinone biosynthesis C-methylase UbiE
MSSVKIQQWLDGAIKGNDGIYGEVSIFDDQSLEVQMREKVAKADIDRHMDVISNHHSIPVMDHEVGLFLEKIPQDGVIIDIGGCWGWHWRNLRTQRPDITVVIVDLVRSNLLHASRLLGNNIDHSIFLVHGDATSLDFEDCTFDGVWTVQTLQHIPKFELAVSETYRVLTKKGWFCNYSLNHQMPIQFLYKLLCKTYVSEGWVDGMFWLARASIEQRKIIEEIYASSVALRWSEILYSPELHFSLPGKEGSLLGRIDCRISNNISFMGWFARQLSFHCQK